MPLLALRGTISMLSHQLLSLASGRLPDDASFFAVDAKLPMHVIALNGAVTLVKPLGDVQEAHHLPQPTVHRITARLDEANVQYAVFGVHEVVASDDMPLSRAQVVIGTFLNRAGGRTAFRNRKQGNLENQDSKTALSAQLKLEGIGLFGRMIALRQGMGA